MRGGTLTVLPNSRPSCSLSAVDPSLQHIVPSLTFLPGCSDAKRRRDNYADMQRRAVTDLQPIPLMEMRIITVASGRPFDHTVTADGVIGGSFATAYLATAP